MLWLHVCSDLDAYQSFFFPDFYSANFDVVYEDCFAICIQEVRAHHIFCNVCSPQIDKVHVIVFSMLSPSAQHALGDACKGCLASSSPGIKAATVR